MLSSYTFFAGTLSRKTVGFTTDKEDPWVKVLVANAIFERLQSFEGTLEPNDNSMVRPSSTHGESERRSRAWSPTFCLLRLQKKPTLQLKYLGFLPLQNPPASG